MHEGSQQPLHSRHMCLTTSGSESAVPGSHTLSLLQDGLRLVCQAGIAACKANPASPPTVELAKASMCAALDQLKLQRDTVDPGWAMLAGGNHGIDSLLIAPLHGLPGRMLYFFVQSKASRNDGTVSLPEILDELRQNMGMNGIELPTLDKQVPGEFPHNAHSIIRLQKILLPNINIIIIPANIRASET